MSAPLSLRGRAIALLAQREQSVLELQRKLLRHALAPMRQQNPRDGGHAGVREESDGAVDASRSDGSDADIDAHGAVDASAARADALARVADVIAWLQANDYLSERRFVESRVHARASRYGNQRIRQELSQHGVSLSTDEAAALKSSELERATAVWQRKFAGPAEDASGRARQARFLIGRGFSSDVVRRVVLGKAG